ncbi:MAG: hypothetical protein AB7J13_13840 [Pyrinomonadaceae bacterium]
MALSPEGLELRRPFLTRAHFELLSDIGDMEKDPFTMSGDFPRTFKIGECYQKSATNVDLQVQIYWRDDESTEQREVVANMVEVDGRWLLDSVGSKGR